jgi:hypothetical protein
MSAVVTFVTTRCPRWGFKWCPTRLSVSRFVLAAQSPEAVSNQRSKSSARVPAWTRAQEASSAKRTSSRRAAPSLPRTVLAAQRWRPL